MNARRGKDLLLKVSAGGDPAQFITVAGLRSRSLSLNAQTVDVTHAESEGGWRELLMGAGIRQASLSGNGIFLNEESGMRTRQLFFDGEIQPWQICLPGVGIIQGPFQIVNLDYAGEFEGEITVALALESAGALTFIAEVMA